MRRPAWPLRRGPAPGPPAARHGRPPRSPGPGRPVRPPAPARRAGSAGPHRSARSPCRWPPFPPRRRSPCPRAARRPRATDRHSGRMARGGSTRATGTPPRRRPPEPRPLRPGWPGSSRAAGFIRPHQSLLFAASGGPTSSLAKSLGPLGTRPVTAAALRLVITSTNSVAPGVAWARRAYRTRSRNQRCDLTVRAQGHASIEEGRRAGDNFRSLLPQVLLRFRVALDVSLSARRWCWRAGVSLGSLGLQRQ